MTPEDEKKLRAELDSQLFHGMSVAERDNMTFMQAINAAIRAADSRWGSEAISLASRIHDREVAELKRFREREPLVLAVFKELVAAKDSFYGVEFSPAAIEMMRSCISSAADTTGAAAETAGDNLEASAQTRETTED